MKKKPKILFICKKRNNSYGVCFGLLNSANMLASRLAKCGFDTNVVQVMDANGIDREVAAYDPTHVIIHAIWITPQKMREIIALPRHAGRVWNVRIHSKPAFLAMEGVATEWIMGYKQIQVSSPNLWVTANSVEMNKALIEVMGLRSAFLPNAYWTEVKPKKSIRSDELNVGCFGAVRPLKNHYAQALAAIRFADRRGSHMNFHVNSDRTEQSGERVVKNLRALFSGTNHNLVEVPWAAHATFAGEVIPEMDVGMQVSISETFDIVAADMVAAGVPVVASKDVYWLPGIFMADHSSVASMERAIDRALSAGRVGIFFSRISLELFSRIATMVWRRWIAASVN